MKLHFVDDPSLSKPDTLDQLSRQKNIRKVHPSRLILALLDMSPLQEREDTLRRRNMTDDERRMEDMMLGKHLGKDKGTIKFMQKYYHKGAFYMVSKGFCLHLGMVLSWTTFARRRRFLSNLILGKICLGCRER